MSLALCSFQRQNKRAKERGWRGVSPDWFTVGAGEAREKNENLGTRNLPWAGKKNLALLLPIMDFRRK